MSFEQYAQVETQVLEMPYEQQIRLLYVIASQLQKSNLSSPKTTTRPNRQFGVAKGRFSYPKNFDEDNEEIAELFVAV